MKNRLQSLDVFRGLTIAFMIIVNTPGDWSIAYDMLEHAKWHGFTPTDLVFPSFVFITGVSTWFSLKQYNHTFSIDLLKKIWKRALIIFLLGVALYAFPFYNRPLSTWRILGVLQRIALCYGLGATLSLVLNKKQIIGLCGALLLGYWAILAQFGDLSLENNAARQLDLWLFGETHLYKGEGIFFDPEGLLSTLPALVTYFIGYLVGQYIGQVQDRMAAFKNLLLWSVILIIGGLVWNFGFPINKKLWTSSYVLFAGGLSMMIFALTYLIVDIFEIKGWIKPFEIFGTNAILAYLVSEFLVIIISEFIKIQEAADITIDGHEAAYRYLFTFWLGRNDFSSFMFALFYAATCWLVVYLFYRKGLFLKV
jgi:predicted acyltransferase